MSTKSDIRRHLARDYDEPIRDPIWSHIYLSRGLKAVLSTRELQKITGIKQLGPTYLVYPGATHTRFNHSLGVFELAKRLITALLRFETDDLISPEGVRAFLCASLLHDLGHYPYAHSLKELPLHDHEALTGRTILTTPLGDTIRNRVEVDPEMVAAIVDLDADYRESHELRLYRRLLSGMLDPDKLDYLTRDAYFCGVSYGVQDVDFVLSKIRYDRTEGVIFDAQGLPAIENVLFSKYLMYRTVYWHKAVRSATSMIKKAVHSAMQAGLLDPEQVYGIDDEEFVRLLARINLPACRLVGYVAERNLHKMVVERPVEEMQGTCARLSDLFVRSEAETRIASLLSDMLGRKISGESIVIDIPESISFEVDLKIVRNGRLLPFVESGSVFGQQVVSGFERSLRTIRVFVAPDVAAEIDDPSIIVGCLENP